MARRGAKEIQSAIAENIDIDELAISGVAHIELMGNRKAIIDGCIGILDCNDGFVRLNTGKNTVSFKGDKLSICNMSYEQTVVIGNILSVDFT